MGGVECWSQKPHRGPGRGRCGHQAAGWMSEEPASPSSLSHCGSGLHPGALTALNLGCAPPQSRPPVCFDKGQWHGPCLHDTEFLGALGSWLATLLFLQEGRGRAPGSNGGHWGAG